MFSEDKVQDQKSYGRDFPGGPVVKNLPCNAEDMSLIPGWGTKISHASKVMLKILQASLQQYVNHELPYVQARQRNQRSNCQHPLDV